MHESYVVNDRTSKNPECMKSLQEYQCDANS